MRISDWSSDVCSSDLRARTDRNRRHQRAVRSDEGPLADARTIFEETVVIAGNRARTNIRARPHIGIAEIGQMVRLRARPHHRLLHLDAIAHPGPLAPTPPRTAEPRSGKECVRR